MILPVDSLIGFLTQVSEPCIVNKTDLLQVWGLKDGHNHISLALCLQSDGLILHLGTALLENFLNICVGAGDGDSAESLGSIDLIHLSDIECKIVKALEGKHGQIRNFLEAYFLPKS